ncbi:2333_t:CDS:10, partial [Entrophospora sp. SA101]
ISCKMNSTNPYRTLGDANVNYEEEEAREWRQPFSRVSRRDRPDEDPQYRDESVEQATAKTVPDEVWLIPPNLRPLEILGEKDCNKARIESTTNTHMKYNNLEQALKQWNNLAENILTEQQKEKSKRRVKGWARPEKALTDKQLRKLQRKEAREKEEQDYRGVCEDKPFYGVFLFPNAQIPIPMIIGEKTEILDPIRVETKCYIWNDRNYIKVAGNTLESVEEATKRIKNLYIKANALRHIPQNQKEAHLKNKRRGWIYHLVEEPKFPYLVKISDKPSWLTAPYDSTGIVKVFEPVIDSKLDEMILNEKTKFDTGILEEIRNSNPITIEDALKQALGTVHLFDEEIKMRIRFGHVCLTDFPKDPLWPVEKLHYKVLNDSRLQSKFSTCITKDIKKINQFCAILDGKDVNSKDGVENNQWDNSPIQEFKICATRAPLARNESTWDCSFDVQFKDDGKIGLWSTVTDEKNVMEINMICLDKQVFDYSWCLGIQTAKHLSNDKFSPQGIFVYKLRLSPQNRLIYTNTDKVQVTSICQKTKWKYWWGEHYVVEVTRYEYWKCDSFKNISAGVEIIMDKEEPFSVRYGVTLYKKSWDDDFAFNSALSVGEVPEWHPYDIVDDEKIGGIKGLIGEIRKFLNMLQTNIPTPPVNTPQC